MGGLKLFLLGPFEATLDDVPLAGLRSNKGRGLLAYLASRPGFPHQRETLATLLWGEVSEEAARLSLRVALSNLRDMLAPLLVAPGVPPLLETTRHYVQLNVASLPCWIDASEFDALLAACSSHADAHSSIAHCPTCIERLMKAVALYRGDFLADLVFPNSPPFDEWRVLQQERYHRQTLTALGQITQYQLSLGDYTAAQQTARHQLELEPWREEAHRQLMSSLALDGQRNAALAQYEVARRILANELGAHPEAETSTLYAQVLAGSTSQEASPSADRRRVVLSPSLTPFVGREQELKRIGELLGDPACRLLTLLGPGGIGKTRLAQQAAVQYSSLFPQGAYYVSLNFADSADVLSMTLAEALHVPLAQADAPSFAPLALYLRDRAMLLVLDDCVPAPEVATWIVDLLRSAPGIKIIALARQRLYVRGEWLERVEGLAYHAPCVTPPLLFEEPVTSEEDVQACSAVQLFVDCARRIVPHFELSAECLPSVVRICQLVDGMPLAIELAAAWTPVVSCREIAAEIQNNLDFLATTLKDVPERQRSLRAVFQQTWALLPTEEQAAFARLAIFPGTFDRAAAEAVAGTPLAILATLADKSLLHRVETGNGRSEPCFSLHIVLQQYALEELAHLPSEPQRTMERHAEYYLAFLAQQAAALEGPQQQTALAEIADRIDNVRMAWEWTLANGRVEMLNNAWNALYTFYNVRSWFREGDAAFGRLVAALNSKSDQATGVAKTLLGVALATQGWFTYQLAHYGLAEEMMRQGLDHLRGQNAPELLAFALSRRGAMALHIGAYGEARQACQESLELFQGLDNRIGMAMVLGFLGQLALEQGQYDEAQQHCRASLELARSLGNRWRIAFPLTHLARVAIAQGDYKGGQALLQEALVIRQERGDQRGVATTYLYLGDLERARRDWSTARRRYGQALGVFWRLGHWQGITRSLLRIAVALAEAGQREEALLVLTVLRDHPECAQNDLMCVEDLAAVVAGQLPASVVLSIRDRALTSSLEAEIQRYALYPS